MSGVTTFIPTRLFTVDEADALVPRLAALFDAVRPEVELARRLVRELTALGHPPRDPSRVEADRAAPVEVQRLQRQLEASFERLANGLQEVADLGVEVKSAEGLVDFRSLRHGAVVHLCWRYGEERVAHWHEIAAGYAGRAPIADPERFRGEPRH